MSLSNILFNHCKFFICKMQKDYHIRDNSDEGIDYRVCDDMYRARDVQKEREGNLRY
jgi:hypothetical protein